MSAPHYPIATLEQMAAIPEEVLPRFLAELPVILSETRQAMAVIASLAAMVDGAAKVNLDPTWVDDDLNQLTRSVTLGDEVLASLTTARPA